MQIVLKTCRLRSGLTIMRSAVYQALKWEILRRCWVSCLARDLAWVAVCCAVFLCWCKNNSKQRRSVLPSSGSNRCPRGSSCRNTKKKKAYIRKYVEKTYNANVFKGLFVSILLLYNHKLPSILGFKKKKD